MANPYSVQKMIYYPDVVDALSKKASHLLNPITIHFMPQNKCNHNCGFCSYRLDNWRNSESFDAKSHLPLKKICSLFDEFEDMVVQGLEITGGGEPLLHPDVDKWLFELSKHTFATALVTNGVLLNEKRADLLFNTNLRWVRISIDAGDKNVYANVRNVASSQWFKAWDAVHRVVHRRTDEVIGVGFVVNEINWHSVYRFCGMAEQANVDNVRISLAFTPKGSNLLDESQYKHVENALELARQDFDVKIYDMVRERFNNCNHERTYDYCATKDLLCVIEGAGNVYACCTLTGSKDGKWGNILHGSFKELWDKSMLWRGKFNIHKHCKGPCLYDARNLVMEGIRNMPDHLEFI